MKQVPKCVWHFAMYLIGWLVVWMLKYEPTLAALPDWDVVQICIWTHITSVLFVIVSGFWGPYILVRGLKRELFSGSGVKTRRQAVRQQQILDIHKDDDPRHMRKP